MGNKLDNQTIASISDLGRRFSDTTILMHEAIAQKAGLSGTDHKYLGLLMQKGAMTAGDLAKLTGLTTGAITGLVDRLEKKNLAKRVFDGEDRRKIMIVPNTEQAMTLLGGIFADLQHKMVNLLSTFSDDELTLIKTYLVATIDVMNDVTRTLQDTDNP
ncbi:MarR family winged helix-turn-helix transcriptional regulator [Spirosoma validum]|uniref:MarR family transcriptional regulator n=1 Tax=Spirosoma validum TaxID=2771355 RepID=A0A927B4I5_9BACT|nr:MarR family transcriptional regulator [Spirosoma validum]MBD2755131.1 MarR family transcriptional regulator [Spirosoma validum]